jgi:hypothetical protein
VQIPRQTRRDSAYFNPPSGATMGLKLHLKNIGHSVASKVMFRENSFQ